MAFFAEFFDCLRYIEMVVEQFSIPILIFRNKLQKVVEGLVRHASDFL